MKKWLMIVLGMAILPAFTDDTGTGWTNINPNRQECPPVKVLWQAPVGDYLVEKEGGAEGEVKIVDRVVTIRKFNDIGRIVVTLPKFKAENGVILRFYADVEIETTNPECAGYLCAWSTKREIAINEKLVTGFNNGGEWMRRMINSAPNTPYRKYRHLKVEGESATLAIVVTGTRSKSVWKNMAAEDMQVADAKWMADFPSRNAPDRRGDMCDEVTFDRELAADIDHTAKVEARDGFAKLIVDGKVTPPIAYKSCEWSVPGRVNYSGKPLQDRAGVKIGVLNLRLGNLGFSPFLGPWSAKGFDAKAAAAKVKEIMRVGDKTLFILALGTSAYPEFSEKEHPDEVWIKKDGKVAYGNSGSITPDTYNDGGSPDPDDKRWPWISMASPAWRAAIKQLTRELFAELKKQGLMKRIIGVHYYGYHDGQLALPILDYSPCAKAAYAKYLKERGIDESDPAGSFEYFSKQLGFLALEDFSREAKRIAGKPIVAVKWNMSPFNTSFDVTSFVKSDVVDILVPQANYHMRGPGTAQGLNATTASYHLHGKLLWIEFDLRTYAGLDKWMQNVIHTKGVTSAEDLIMWKTIIRKNAGMINAARMGWWMYDMAGGWFYPSDIADDFKSIVNIRRELERVKPDPWHPEVAFIVDELAMANYNTPNGPKVEVPSTLATLQWPRNTQSAVPYESYLAEDFYDHPELSKKYKAAILAGFVKPSAKQKALIASLEQAGVKTIVVQPWGLPPKKMNDFARRAGAFVAAEPCMMEVDMNGDFLSVHCLVPGSHIVNLPFVAKVVNLKDGKEYVGDKLELTLTAGETRWYRLIRR